MSSAQFPVDDSRFFVCSFVVIFPTFFRCWTSFFFLRRARAWNRNSSRVSAFYNSEQTAKQSENGFTPNTQHTFWDNRLREIDGKRDEINDAKIGCARLTRKREKNNRQKLHTKTKWCVSVCLYLSSDDLRTERRHTKWCWMRRGVRNSASHSCDLFPLNGRRTHTHTHKNIQVGCCQCQQAMISQSHL